MGKFFVALLALSQAANLTGREDYNPADYLAPCDTVKDGVNLNGVVSVNSGGLVCSGALISPTQVLTAAHYIQNGGTPTSPTAIPVDRRSTRTI